MSYIGNSPGVASQRVTTTLTATAGQTQFTTQSGYVLGYVDVYLNGAKLVNGSDFEAITGTYITLFAGASAGDVVELVSYVPRGLSDGYTKAEADAKFLDVGGDTATGAINLGANGLVVGTTQLVTSGTNNVGINTASPKTNGSTFGTLTLNGSNGGAIQFTTADVNIAQIYNDNNALFINPSTGKTLSLQIAGSTVASVSSTGIAVTGILGASGVATFNSAGTIGAGQVGVKILGPSSDNNWGGRLDLNSNNGTGVKTSIYSSSGGMFFSLDGGTTTAVNIASTGVGIGTTPNYPLDILKTQDASTIVQITNASTGTSARTRLLFTGDASAGSLSAGMHNSAHASYPNQAWIWASGSNTPLVLGTQGTPRLTIDSSGNVTVGNITNYVLPKLFVNGSIAANYNDSFYFKYNVSGSVNNYVKGISGQSPGAGGSARGLHISNYDADSDEGINFWTGVPGSATQTMKINAAGLVGIGTNNPVYQLHVSKSQNSDTTLFVQNTLSNSGGSQQARIILQSGLSGQVASLYSYIAQKADGTTRIGTELNGDVISIIGGKVGIGSGITSPQLNLDLGDATGNRGISWGGTGANYVNIWTTYGSADLNIGTNVKPSGNSTGYYSSFADPGTARNIIRVNAFNGYGIQFFTDTQSSVAVGTAVTPSERMRITPAGNVGIGTNDPQGRLHTLGASYSSVGSGTNHVRFEGGGGNGIAVGTLDSSSGYSTWIQSGYVPSFGTAVYPLFLNPLGASVSVGTQARASTSATKLVVGGGVWHRPTYASSLSGSGNYIFNLFTHCGNTTFAAGVIRVIGTENQVNQTFAEYDFVLSRYVNDGTGAINYYVRLKQRSRTQLNNGYGNVFLYLSNYSGSWTTTDQSASNGTSTVSGSTSIFDIYARNEVGQACSVAISVEFMDI